MAHKQHGTGQRKTKSTFTPPTTLTLNAPNFTKAKVSNFCVAVAYTAPPIVLTRSASPPYTYNNNTTDPGRVWTAVVDPDNHWHILATGGLIAGDWTGPAAADGPEGTYVYTSAIPCVIPLNILAEG